MFKNKTQTQREQPNTQHQYSKTNYMDPNSALNDVPFHQKAQSELNEQNQKYNQNQLEEKTSIFIDELTKQFKIQGFAYIEAAETKQNQGFIYRDEFKNILIKNYNIEENYDFHTCMNHFYSKYPHGVNISELKTIFQIVKVQKTQEDGENLRNQMGINKNKQLVPMEHYDPKRGLQMVEEIKKIYSGNTQSLFETFFPPKGFPTLDRLQFSEKLNLIPNSKYNTKDTNSLFVYLDVNKGGNISFAEFKLAFLDTQRESTNQSNMNISVEMYKEIQQLFKEIDKDGSGFLEFHELKDLFSAIGVNVGPNELKSYIKRFAKENDKGISHSEFQTIMEERLKKEMLTAQHILDDLRIEFKRADTDNTRLLNMHQLGQVFRNLNVSLTQPQLQALFKEIDLDGSNLVDIDEIIYFITKNAENTTGLASAAVLNICSTRKLSLSDLKSAFSGMPSNFRTSFMRANLLKGFNWPSQTLKPKLNHFQIYPELILINDFEDTQSSILNRATYSANKDSYYLEISIDQAIGVPIPQESIVSRQLMIYRDAQICLYNNNSGQFVGNTIKIEASFDDQVPDKWNFIKKDDKNYNKFYLKLAKFDPKKDFNLSLCFELTLHYLPKNINSTKKNVYNSDLEMSCCYGLISLNKFTDKGAYTVHLEGGQPMKPIVIKQEEIIKKKKAITFSENTSFLQLQANLRPQIPPPVMEQILPMPDQSLMNYNSLNFLNSYREYFAFRVFGNRTFNLNLMNDYVFINICRIIDCPDTFNYVCSFWTNFVMKQNLNLQKQYDYIEKIASKFYTLFTAQIFRFQVHDPTSSCYTLDLCRIRFQRYKLVLQALEDLKQLKGVKRLKLLDGNPRPFNISEMMQNDDEDDLKMMEKYLASKTGVDVGTKQIN